MTGGAAYDAVAYHSRPIFECQPARMATIAALAGLDAPQLPGATVLDLGCGDAVNLLALAAADPSITAIGVDPSTTAIARGRSLAEAAALAGVRLVAADRAPVDDGSCDFVIVHGVLSWVGPQVRREVVAEAARAVRPGGLVLLSFNAAPGALRRSLTRSIGRRAASEALAAGDPAAAHAAVIARLRLAAAVGGGGSLHAQVAAAEADRLASEPPEVLFHDELGADWAPLAVSEVAALASDHGLAYVDELRPTDRWRWRLTESEVAHIATLAGPSPVAQQQLTDDLLGAAFHASLFCRPPGDRASGPSAAGAQDPAHTALGPAAATAVPGTAAWHVHARDGDDWPTPPDAGRGRFVRALRAAGHAGGSVGELAEAAGVEAALALRFAGELDALPLAVLSCTRPVRSPRPGQRPIASPLARAEVRAGARLVTSLEHREVALEHPVARALVELLDGTRDRATLAEALRALDHPDAAATADHLDDNLRQLAQAGLLQA